MPTPIATSAAVAPYASTASTSAVPSDPAIQALRSFQESQIRFRLPDLMAILRDRRHEGWILTAYPDPKTSRPLLGAGFSLDLPERGHPQHDQFNPNQFLEPSSLELWQAAGLEPKRLQRILDDYHMRINSWGVRRFRRHLAGLDPEISDAEASSLLRIAVIQAIANARAYCRDFDNLTASQQMALTQLVYQMGVNLEEFTDFLSLINSDSGPSLTTASASVPVAPQTDRNRWYAVQKALEQSQWARLYRSRAVAVIAMLDPTYSQSPSLAERRIAATLRPAVIRRRRVRSVSGLRMVSTGQPRHSRPRTHRAARGRRKV
ncbi:MAG TPA: hypothetical protein VIY53_06985 [Acidobacteriaceae bacterium]